MGTLPGMKQRASLEGAYYARTLGIRQAAPPMCRCPRPSGRGTLRIQASLVQRRALNLAHTPALPGGDLPLD